MHPHGAVPAERLHRLVAGRAGADRHRGAEPSRQGEQLKTRLAGLSRDVPDEHQNLRHGDPSSDELVRGQEAGEQPASLAVVGHRGPGHPGGPGRDLVDHRPGRGADLVGGHPEVAEGPGLQ